MEKAKKYLEQNNSTCDDEAPLSSAHKDDEPESADVGGIMADADEEEGSQALCPVALPQTSPRLEQMREPKYITRVRS